MTSRLAMLLVAYGAAGPQARSALRSFEQACRQRFPGLPLRWAFTSCLGRERLARQRQKSDSVYKALMRLSFEGFHRVALQPLQTIAGCEHENVREALGEARQERPNLHCVLGKPLLHPEQDLNLVAQALMGYVPPERQPTESVILMGHGARHMAGSVYADLAAAVYARDAQIHVGTMHAICPLEEILPRLNPGPVWLLPLLSTVGMHALRDMAGKDPASWRSRIEVLGHECRPLLRGMAESPAIQRLWLDNLEEALEQTGSNP